MKSPARISDTITNLVSGLFTSRDKASTNQHTLRALTRADLERAYRGDWIARKAVDIPALDATRQWRTWQAEDDQITLIEKAERRLGIRPKVRAALTKARLYGGAGLVLGVGDDAPEDELNPEAVGEGDLRWVHVMAAHELGAGARVLDIESPYFGEPEVYQITADSGRVVSVHPSRVIRLIGGELPDPQLNGTGWGDSVLLAIYDAVMNAGVAMQGVASLIEEAKVDIVRVPNLMQSLATAEYSTRLVERFALAQTMKSINHTMLLDAEEEYDRKQINFAQLPETIRQYLQIVAGAADIPATRMIGESPGGLNATGDADIRNYYDRVRAAQELDLTPALERLDEVLIRSATGQRDEEISFEWESLWQTPEKERAEIGKARAETVQIWANLALFPEAALAKASANLLMETGDFPGFEQALDEAGGVEAPEREAEPDAPRLEQGQEAALAADAAPMPLYVRRNVLNGAEIIKWARGEGFKTTLPAKDMHVTIVFSRLPVDWMAMGASYQDRIEIPEGGPRLMEQFGEARVLLIAADSLQWRHERAKEIGGSWDHGDYQPHITISYDPDSPDLADVKPYTGKIILGPEIFEPVDEDWAKKVTAQAV